jgi:hypothetical protein
MKLGLQRVTIKSLKRRNWLDTEMRTIINRAKVFQYADEMKDGVKFPVPKAFIDPATELVRVGDGFHRILAHEENGEKEVMVDLQRGGFRDAFLCCITTNRDQKGLPFSFGDKEKCILTLLRDEVTQKWTQSKIAETVGCAMSYVSNVVRKHAEARPEVVIGKDGNPIRPMRGEGTKRRSALLVRREQVFELHKQHLPQKEICKQVGVGFSTVQRYISDSMREHDLIPCPHCGGTGMVQKGATP